MKRVVTSLFFAAALSLSPVFADLEVPGEANPVLAENSFALKEATYNVIKRIDKNSVTLRVFNAKGEQFWSSDALGEQEKMFVLDGNATGLAIRDLTGDSIPELITAAMTGPDSSALYVFKLDSEAGKFVPMNFKYEKENLTRDFLVSDMYQKDGQDFCFLPENLIRALGKIYSEEAAPVAGFYTFKLTDGAFVCSEVTPVPVDAPADPAGKTPDQK